MQWKRAVESLIKGGDIEGASALIRVHHQRLLREAEGAPQIKIEHVSEILEVKLYPSSQACAFDSTDGESIQMRYLPTDLEVFRRQFFLEEGRENWGFWLWHGRHGLSASCAEVEFEEAVFADNESRRAFFEVAKTILEGSSLFSDEVNKDEVGFVANLALLWVVVELQLKLE
jgi:hypothetical protein